MQLRPGVLVVIAAVVLGCGGSPAAQPAQLSNTTRTAPGATASTALFTIGVDSLGPITGKTPANLTALRELLGKRGYEVVEVERNGIEYHVLHGTELLFYVIPGDDGSLFNVHVVSPKVDIAQHPQWKIGAPFTGDEILTHCECWGTSPVCFKRGDHVAVAFARTCQGLDDERMRKVLVGVDIQRAVWSPTPFGFDDADPCGGMPGGGIPGVPDPCGP